MDPCGWQYFSSCPKDNLFDWLIPVCVVVVVFLSLCWQVLALVGSFFFGQGRWGCEHCRDVKIANWLFWAYLWVVLFSVEVGCVSGWDQKNYHRGVVFALLLLLLQEVGKCRLATCWSRDCSDRYWCPMKSYLGKIKRLIPFGQMELFFICECSRPQL